MRVFVAGGAGFIGSSLTNVLLREQHEVTVLDNLSKGFRTLVPPKARFIEGDLRDEERLAGWLRGHDAVIHMAAFIEVGRSVQEPVLFAENNVVNSVRLLEAMHRAPLAQLDGQLAIGMQRALVDQEAARAVHGLHRVGLLILLGEVQTIGMIVFNVCRTKTLKIRS